MFLVARPMCARMKRCHRNQRRLLGPASNRRTKADGQYTAISRKRIIADKRCMIQDWTRIASSIKWIGTEPNGNRQHRACWYRRFVGLGCVDKTKSNKREANHPRSHDHSEVNRTRPLGEERTGKMVWSRDQWVSGLIKHTQVGGSALVHKTTVQSLVTRVKDWNYNVK